MLSPTLENIRRQFVCGSGIGFRGEDINVIYEGMVIYVGEGAEPEPKAGGSNLSLCVMPEVGVGLRLTVVTAAADCRISRVPAILLTTNAV